MSIGDVPYLSCWCGQGLSFSSKENLFICKNCEDSKRKWQLRKEGVAMWLLLGPEILPAELSMYIAEYLADVLPDDA